MIHTFNIKFANNINQKYLTTPQLNDIYLILKKLNTYLKKYNKKKTDYYRLILFNLLTELNYYINFYNCIEECAYFIENKELFNEIIEEFKNVKRSR